MSALAAVMLPAGAAAEAGAFPPEAVRLPCPLAVAVTAAVAAVPSANSVLRKSSTSLIFIRCAPAGLLFAGSGACMDCLPLSRRPMRALPIAVTNHS